MGVNIDGPTWRRWQIVKQSLNAARIGAKDELPLVLAGDAMRERGRWPHQIDFDVLIAGMASEGVSQFISFDGALLVR